MSAAVLAGAVAIALGSAARWPRRHADQYACAQPTQAQPQAQSQPRRERDEPAAGQQAPDQLSDRDNQPGGDDPDTGAEGQRREPDGRRGRGGPGRMAPFDFGWGGYGRFGTADNPSPRPHEWAETQFFMNRYSPRRQAALEELPDDDRKESLKRYVFARYRALQAQRRRDPATYELRVAQLTVEDEIFGLVSDWGGGADDGGQEARRLKEALRERVERLLDLNAQETRRRVEWLKKQLEEQTQKLERDEKERDQQVERRASRYADWAEKWAARRARQGQRQDGQDAAKPQPQPPAPDTVD